MNANKEKWDESVNTLKAQVKDIKKANKALVKENKRLEKYCKNNKYVVPVLKTPEEINKYLTKEKRKLQKKARQLLKAEAAAAEVTETDESSDN